MIYVSVTGCVGSEPQVRDVNEQRVASFSVAASRKNAARNKQTVCVRGSCWNKLADVATQYVHKGSLVQVTTEWLRLSAWLDDQSGTPYASADVDASRLVLLDRLESDEPES